MNEYAVITYAFKEGNLKKCLAENKLDENFVIVGDNAKYSLSLNVDELTLKPGDTMKLNIIVMPWGHYDSANDDSVRAVRENTCIDPLTVEVSKGEKIESVYVPKVLATDGKSTEFTLSGGYDNIVVSGKNADKDAFTIKFYLDK